MNFWLKALISGVIIAAVSELARRFTLLASILASLPLVSILAMIWLYLETRSPEKVAALSNGIFWAVLPSLLFFLLLPLLLHQGLRFWNALTLASICMIAAYAVYAWLARRLGAGFL